MSLSEKNPPENICILRLSAIGDVTHVLPVLRTLQRRWPGARITWLVGRTEARLLEGIGNVELIVIDKAGGMRALLELRQRLKGRRFDILLHMQPSFRANLASLAVRAPVRIGFDRGRARNFQFLFTNRQIASRPRQHVLEGFLEFPRALGIDEPVLEWEVPIPDSARENVDRLLPSGRFIVVNPCSSARLHNWRNWSAESYAAVIDHVAERYGLPTVLTGGGTPLEREYARNISEAASSNPLDLIGRTSLKELWEILRRADLLIAPDTGPAHMASAAGTPVVGLYASSNPERTGPYRHRHLTVNRYPEAVMREFGKSVDELPWGKRVRRPDVMELISPEDVIGKIEEALALQEVRS